MIEGDIDRWEAVARLLSKNEIAVILEIEPSLDADVLKTTYVKEYLVDHSLTIRNANLFDQPLNYSLRQDGVDLDGAIVELIIFKSPAGEFGELEISRLDLEPLLMKRSPRL